MIYKVKIREIKFCGCGDEGDMLIELMIMITAI